MHTIFYMEIKLKNLAISYNFDDKRVPFILSKVVREKRGLHKQKKGGKWMRHLPDMNHFKDIENVRRVYLKALSYFHFERKEEPKPWREKEDIYALSKSDWDKSLKAVTKEEDVEGWKKLFRDLGWVKAKKGKLHTQRRFDGSKPVSVVGIDKQMYELLKAMEPTQEKGKNATTEKREKEI